MIHLKPESGRGGVSFQFLDLHCWRLTASAIPGRLAANPGIRMMHTNTWGGWLRCIALQLLGVRVVVSGRAGEDLKILEFMPTKPTGERERVREISYPVVRRPVFMSERCPPSVQPRLFASLRLGTGRSVGGTTSRSGRFRVDMMGSQASRRGEFTKRCRARSSRGQTWSPFGGCEAAASKIAPSGRPAGHSSSDVGGASREFREGLRYASTWPTDFLVAQRDRPCLTPDRSMDGGVCGRSSIAVRPQR